jgi:hypothetical protein
MLKQLFAKVWRQSDSSSMRVTPNDLQPPTRSPEPIHLATDVVVPGALTVDVVRHELMSGHGRIPCWSLISDGLHSLGQKEICFSVKIEPGEGDADYPRSLYALYSAVYRFATESRIVDVGGVTALGAGSGLLGRADFTGVAYSIPQFFTSLPRAVNALTGLILTTGEFDVVRQFGLMRVAALLGDEYRFFPTAPWADRTRRELISPADMTASILSKVPRLAIADGVVYLRGSHQNRPVSTVPLAADRLICFAGQEVVLDIGPSGLTKLATALGSLAIDSPVAVIASPDPAADSCLVWHHGATSGRAISGPGSTNSRLAGNHVLFVPAQSRNIVQVGEDGFAVRLTTEAWSAFRRAVTSESPSWTLPDGAPLRFQFRSAAGDSPFPEQVFHNPMDGKAYVTSGRWEQYPPSGSIVDDQAGCRVKTDHIRLLTEQDRIPERTTTAALADFIGVIERLANEHLATSETAFQLLIQFTCTPTGHDVKMAATSEAPGELVRALLSALERADPVPVARDDVTFQIQMSVAAATGSTIGSAGT